jgi:hypothetical protein
LSASDQAYLLPTNPIVSIFSVVNVSVYIMPLSLFV